MVISSVRSYMKYKHTCLSKVHVSSCFINIYKRLVKDRKSYALHNGRELIIMQMRTESGKLEHEGYLKEGGEGNPAKPGKLPKSDDITMTCMTYEHPHGTPRQENNKLPPEQTKPKYKQNIQTLPSHGTWLGSHRSLQEYGNGFTLGARQQIVEITADGQRPFALHFHGSSFFCQRHSRILDPVNTHTQDVHILWIPVLCLISQLFHELVCIMECA